MNYKILIGKIIELGDDKIEVETIREYEHPFIGNIEFIVNDKHRVTQFQMGTLVTLEELKSQKRGLLSKYGIFVWSAKLAQERKLGVTAGRRFYGYTTAGFSIEFYFGTDIYALEFVFNDKKLYENKVLPFIGAKTKKIL